MSKEHSFLVGSILIQINCIMTLKEEYKKQNMWRNWPAYLQKIPLVSGETILDLGCGLGYVTKLMADKALHVIGIDSNAELLAEATTLNNASNIRYVQEDLRRINPQDLPLADGIWTSFTVAYFPDFVPILQQWLALLKPTGWIAIVEISDLFAHYPIRSTNRDILRNYYDQQRRAGIYDFEMGSKVKDIVVNEGLSITHEENMSDKELSFNGPADEQIVLAWETRLNRMVGFQNQFDKDTYPAFKREFLASLLDAEHVCTTEVKFIIARK